MTTPPSDVAIEAPPYVPVAWTEQGGAPAVRLLDQTRLPHALEYLHLQDVEAVATAIETMRVRGAPAIGVTAAYGLALAAALAPEGGVRTAVGAARERLEATRPTAVNLRWALDRVQQRVHAAASDDAARGDAYQEARRLHDDQRDADLAMVEAGASLLSPGSTVITHCNTGPLATAGLGTALGVAIHAHRAGLVRAVLVDETRPRLQGARLTTWELEQHGVPYRLMADSAAAYVLGRGGARAVLVGADRIAANGDTANKIGTYGLAIAAHHHGVPFYVVAPTSTIDATMPAGEGIPIERRDGDEVLRIDGASIAAEGAQALNPAFDVTPAALITAIVTEHGILRPPFAASINGALAAAGEERGGGRKRGA